MTNRQNAFVYAMNKTQTGMTKYITGCTGATVNTYTLLLVVNSNLDPILHRFRDTAA